MYNEILMSFFKTYLRNNWFEIWYYYSYLVAFATIETKCNKIK